MAKSSIRRDPALDILRCIALYCVIGVHFFVHTGYMSKLVMGARMYILTVLRSGFMVCVPLFIMLSGYLMKNKQPERKYYSKLVKTIFIYVLASICCYYYQYIRGLDPALTGSLTDLLLKTLDFTASPYGWYMCMYLGLFLLIPYLNLIYNNLPDKESRQKLLLTMVLLTSVTKVVNIFRYSSAGGWSLVENTYEYQALLPYWWEYLYPVTYYFFGSYLRDHPIRFSRIANLLLILTAMLLNGTLNFFLSYNKTFLSGPWQDWGSLLNVIQSVLVFQFVAHGNYSKLGSKSCAFLAQLSDLCLGAYLVSWIFDHIFYTLLDKVQSVPAYKLEYFPVVTLLIFVCSLGLSGVLQLVYTGLSKLAVMIHPGKTAPK